MAHEPALGVLDAWTIWDEATDTRATVGTYFTEEQASRAIDGWLKRGVAGKRPNPHARRLVPRQITRKR